MIRYRLIKNVRFQRGIPKEWIDLFFGKKETPEKFRYMANDDLCYMEHKAGGGSAPTSLYPLTPYSILSEKRTVGEVAKGRNRQGMMIGQYVIDPANDYQVIYGGKDGGNILLRIPKSIRQAFFETILAFEPIFIDDSKYPILFCQFSKPVFDPKNSRIILPNLMSVNHVRLAMKFSAKIRLKEFLASENDITRTVIDQKGWRVDLM